MSNDPLAGETSSSSSTSSSGYSVDQFYTGSRDRRGFRGSTYKIQVSPEVSGELAALVASKEFPEYRTSHDVIRDALVHRLHWLSEHTAEPRTSVIVQRMTADYILQEAVDIMRYRKNAINSLESMAREVRTPEDRNHCKAAIQRAVESDPELASEAQRIIGFIQ